MPTFTLISGSVTVKHVEYPAGVKPSSPHIAGEHELGKYWNGSTLQTNPPIADQKEALKADNLARRIARLNEGFEYTFPNGVGVIQTRNDTDLGNVNAVATTAIVLQGQGVTDPVISFRDQGNVTHNLTPAQAIAMGVAVSAFVSAVYANKWRIDDEIIDVAVDQSEVDAIDLESEWSAI